MKGSYFGFGSPQQQVDMHVMSKNTFIVLYVFIFTLFAHRLPNKSLNDSFFQTSPLRDANLRWLVDFIMPVMPDKGQCCFVYSVTEETAILMLQKRHLVAKNEFAFSCRPTPKSSFLRSARATSGRAMNRLGIRFKNDSFQWFSRLFLLRDNNLIHGALSDLKLCRMFSFT